MLSQAKFPTPKYRSINSKKGTKYLAFTGTGMNINCNSVLGNKYAKATNNPEIAPEAPTKFPYAGLILPQSDSVMLILFS